MQTRIEGYVRTLSPVHQTRPVSGYYSRATPNIVSYFDHRQGQCAVMMRSSFVASDGRIVELPIVTSNSFRGLLRRHCTRILLDAINQPMKADLFQSVSVGAAARQGIDTSQTALFLHKARSHIFAGLFGGGPAMLTGAYSMADLFPVAESIEHLVVPWVRDIVRPVGVSQSEQLTHVYLTIRRDPLLDGEGAKYIYEHDREFMMYQAEVLAEKRKKSTEIEAQPEEQKGRSGVRMISYVEAMIPGVSLNFSLRMKPYLSSAQIGLLLLGVADWANAQTLGGLSRRGFGQFQPQLRFYHETLDEPLDLLRPIGADSTDRYALNPAAGPFIDAALESLSKTTLAELEELYLVCTQPGPNAKRKAAAPKG